MKLKPTKIVVPKKTTRFTMDTKMTKENEKALKVVKAIKGMFG